MIGLRTVSLAGVLAVAAGLPSAAQAIVNIEGIRSGGGKETGISGSLSLSVNGASGNTDKIAASTSGRVDWTREHSVTFLIASLSYGEDKQVRNTNKAFGHLRHVIERSERLGYEGFIQAERNEFTRLSLRTLAGGGVRLTLHDNDLGKTHIGLGAFRSAETLDESAGLTDSGTERLWRANIYLAIHYALTKQLRIDSVSYYQPSTSDTSDYRLLELATLKFAITDQLALKMSLDIAHDSLPPQTIEKTDTSYMTGLEYSF